jgi:hypothetical protein
MNAAAADASNYYEAKQLLRGLSRRKRKHREENSWALNHSQLVGVRIRKP